MDTTGWIKRHKFWTSVIIMYVLYSWYDRYNVIRGDLEYATYWTGMYVVFGSIIKWIVMHWHKRVFSNNTNKEAHNAKP